MLTLLSIVIVLLAGGSSAPASPQTAASTNPVTPICNGPIPGVPGGGTGPTNPQPCP